MQNSRVYRSRLVANARSAAESEASIWHGERPADAETVAELRAELPAELPAVISESSESSESLWTSTGRLARRRRCCRWRGGRHRMRVCADQRGRSMMWSTGHSKGSAIVRAPPARHPSIPPQ